MLAERQVGLESLNVPDRELYHAMGYRGSVPDQIVQECIDQVRAEIAAVCAPRYIYRMLDAELRSKQVLRVGELEFTPGGVICSYLSGVSQLCLFVATAGVEYDAYLHRLKSQGDLLKEYVADSLGSVIAEACVAQLETELEGFADLHHSLPYSPGYCGWNICEQQKLFSLFPPLPCGVTLSDSSLMSPIKSVSGFYALGARLQPQPYRCEICTNKQCYKRKERNV